MANTWPIPILGTWHCLQEINIMLHSSVVLVMQFTFSFSFSQDVDLLLVLVFALVKMSIYF